MGKEKINVEEAMKPENLENTIAETKDHFKDRSQVFINDHFNNSTKIWLRGELLVVLYEFITESRYSDYESLKDEYDKMDFGKNYGAKLLASNETHQAMSNIF